MFANQCPGCGRKMAPGFVQAGEEGREVIHWSTTDPRQTLEPALPLYPCPVVRSFRLSSAEPSCLAAHRCETCRLVVFEYPEGAAGD
jgi:hypothetical protein